MGIFGLEMPKYLNMLLNGKDFGRPMNKLNI